MLTKTSKVYELFSGMNSVLKHKRDFDRYAEILREMIHERIISGKMLLGDFFDEKTANRWLEYIEREYNAADAREMYSIVLDIPRDFAVTRVPKYNEEDVAGPPVTSKKQQWMDAMRPLAKALVTKEVSAEALLTVLWETLDCKNEDMNSLFHMGKLLYAKMN